MNNSPEAAATRAAEAARIRKEKRAKKILAGSSSRLEKITGVSGHPASDLTNIPPVSSETAPTTKPTTATTTTDSLPAADPAEVDISTHFYEPTTIPRPPFPTFTATPAGAASGDPTESQFHNLMLGLDPAVTGTAAPLNLEGLLGGPGPSDPMAMLSQLLNGKTGGPSGVLGVPPGPQLPVRKSSSVFTILHTLFILALSLYITLLTPFTGTLSSRLDPTANHFTLSLDNPRIQSPRDLLWVFATGEALLLSAEYLSEGEQGGQVGGIIGTVVGLLPGKWQTRVREVVRYGRFVGTVRRDVMLCVFILGLVAWIKA